MVISQIGHWIKVSPYTRPEIQEEFDISANTLSNWCTGNTYPSVPQLFKLANMLGVTVNDMYVYKED